MCVSGPFANRFLGQMCLRARAEHVCRTALTDEHRLGRSSLFGTFEAASHDPRRLPSQLPRILSVEDIFFFGEARGLALNLCATCEKTGMTGKGASYGPPS